MTEINEETKELSVQVLPPGVARLKQEFIVATNRQENKNVDSLSDEPDAKKSKLDNEKGKKKQRGQNKARGVPWQQERSAMLCSSVGNVLEGKEFPLKCNRDNCKFQHDIENYMKNKPKDIGEICPVFIKYGYCHWGAACRFGSGHLTDDGHNKIDNNIHKPEYTTDSTNQLDKDVQFKLRKFKYDFKKAEDALTNTRKEIEIEKSSTTETNIMVDFPKEKQIIDWKDKLYLSPLTTLGNLPFRRICKTYGADITCGEMAMANSLLQGNPQEWALVRRHESEDLFGVQVCGSNPMSMARCAQLLQETTDIKFIDINMGCPIDLVYQQGAGSGLMRRKPCLELIVRTMNKLLDIPLTIKMRTGIASGKNTAHTIMPNLQKWGISMVTLHGRSREQRYTRVSDWDYIDECSKLTGQIPLFGNGDILSYEDYNIRRINTNVSGVMIGRGALIKPWIFTEIKEQRHWDISSGERFDILKKYTNYGLEHWGSDNKGVETTRRFLLEWLSFLYRYIPVGILEEPPQKINDRPPAYIGRNDLETLMKSANCNDWIIISEMLLGKVPDGFNFLPKHKANAW